MIEAIMDWRLNIDKEFQGWILVFATVTAIFLFCLPCYCAGLSFDSARRFASWLQQRLPTFYLCIGVFNLGFIFFVVQWLPDWDFAQYLVALVQCTVGTLQHVLQCASSLVVIAAFCFAVAFKDRIAQLFGFDHKTIFRFKIRDLLTCLGPSRFQPIELSVWKVDDLASADPFSANNVFIEFFLGYNEPMRTRVHNNAGSGCLIKENMQLNFDEDDEEETLYIFVRNQKIVGHSELARAEILTERLKQMVRKAASYGEQLRFSEEFFGDPIALIPRGRLWLRAAPIRDEDYSQTLFQEMTQC